MIYPRSLRDIVVTLAHGLGALVGGSAMSQSAEKDAPFVIPGEEWLASTLCGWHDAESGRAPGEEFPCAYCAVLTQYVAEQAREAQAFTPHSAAALVASLKAAFTHILPPAVQSPAETDGGQS